MCAVMIWIGTSGWIYPHWRGRFYPPELPTHDHLAFYARHFPTVEINRSFYRLPTFEQFQHWAAQVKIYPDFCFAVKASRYITHMKKLHETEEGVSRLMQSARGLGGHLGPFLYQLPPHWRANIPRLAQFIAQLPAGQRVAFEFRDPSWFRPDAMQALRPLFDTAGCALVASVGGTPGIPEDLPTIGPFGYIRFHHGIHGPGFTDAELAPWVTRLAREQAEEREQFVYFNNDAEAHAIADARRLQQLLCEQAVQVATLPAHARSGDPLA